MQQKDIKENKIQIMNLGTEYLQVTIKRFKYYKDQGDKTFAQLDENDFHFKASSESNSIAVIVQHMAGNMLSRFTNLLTEDGEKEWRQRDAEFEEKSLNRYEILQLWEQGWNCLLQTLDTLAAEDLTKTIYIRKEPLTVVDAINRQLAHYALHIGQLLFIGKMIKNENWKSLSIPKGGSQQYNQSQDVKDPAKKF